MMKKLTSLLLVMFLLIPAFSGCAGNSNPAVAPGSDSGTGTTGTSTTETGAAGTDAPSTPVELTFYYPTQTAGALAAGMEKIVSEFNTSHAGVKVTPVFTGSYKATAEKAMTSIQANNAPNVVLSGMLDIVNYVDVDAVEDITPYLEKEGSAFVNDFVDGFWGNFRFNGALVGVPFQHSTPVLYYNKKMLAAAGLNAENPPTTWEGMIEAVRAVKTANGKVIPLEFPADVWILEAITYSSSGTLVKNTTTPTFDSAEAVAALDFLSTLTHVEKSVMIRNWGDAAEDFIAESCAMMFNTTGNLGAVSTGASFDWNVATLPVKTSPSFSYGGGGMIMLKGQSEEEREASWEFIKYMTSPEVSAQWAIISGYYPVRKSSGSLPAMQEYYAKNPQVKQAADMLQYATAQWFTDNYWDVYACMQTALDEVLIAGGTSAKDALSAAQKNALSALSK